MEISNLELINSKVVSYGARLLPVVKNRTNEEIKFLYEFGFRAVSYTHLRSPRDAHESRMPSSA